MSYPTSQNAMIQATTRELFLKTIKSQVFMRMPLMARMLLKKRISWEGGKFITQPVDKAEMNNSQTYLPGEKLSSGRSTTLENPYFKWKYVQTPVSYDIEEELQNGGSDEVAPVKLVKYLTDKAQREARLKLYRMAYGIDPITKTATTSTDDGKEFQSIRQALTHDTTYGTLARATTVTNQWWQGASIDGTFADGATAYSPSINTFRRAKSAIQMYTEQPGDLLMVVGPAIFLELQSQVEAKHIYNRDGSDLAKFGFNTLMLDGVEVVEDPFLAEAVCANASKWMFLLNIADWELRLHPKRAFNFTGFTWQGDKADGYDEWLGRIMTAGNLICWKPNGSIFLSNVS